MKKFMNEKEYEEVTEESMKQDIKSRVDRLVELTKLQRSIKAEIDELKAWFELQATEELANTKFKTLEYWGTGNKKVTVGNSETVSPVSMQMVKKMFGTVYKDFVTEDTSYTLKAAAKRLFSIVYLGKYTEGTLEKTIESISEDKGIQKLLQKKLKGKYEKDAKALLDILGCSEEEASDWAYLISEVVNWEYMIQVLKAAEWNGTVEEAIELINVAVMVDEKIKVTIESED